LRWRESLRGSFPRFSSSQRIRRRNYQRLNARLVLARALEDVRLIFDQMMNEREPRAERVQLLVLNRLAFFLGQAAKHSRTINARATRQTLRQPGGRALPCRGLSPFLHRLCKCSSQPLEGE